VALLRSLGAVHDYRVMPVSLLRADGQPVSSTRIRSLISQGQVAPAADLLGRPHRISAPVVAGEARGRRLGFPTANLVPPPGLVIPADGIYAVRVGGEATGDGVASLGVRPTFSSGGPRLLEVHLFDFSADLYGATLDVDFIDRIRGEERFDSVGELVAQMESDAQAARRALARQEGRFRLISGEELA
jgi:riboflavin kinase/FMN adenylyltransferase